MPKSKHPNYPKDLHLNIRLIKVGNNLMATTVVGDVPVRGGPSPTGVEFAGGILPVENDTASELRAVQSLLYLLSRTDSQDRDVVDARLGLEMELSGTSIKDVFGTEVTRPAIGGTTDDVIDGDTEDDDEDD